MTAVTFQQYHITGKDGTPIRRSQLSFGVELLNGKSGIFCMTRSPAIPETYISVDVETAGPNPSQYSLLAIGACSVCFPERYFYIELKPVNQQYLPESLTSSGLSLENLAAQGTAPHEAMQRFEAWLQESLPAGQRPVFVGFNAPFDWMFVNDYFHRFLGHNPFGHAAIDIKSYFMGLAGVPWEETTMRYIGQRYLNQPALIHHALKDALDQGEIFRKLLVEGSPDRIDPSLASL
jgi:DNA polymerase III epsilon subunit-like protein